MLGRLQFSFVLDLDSGYLSKQMTKKRKPREISRLGMVGWYDPGQLSRTALQVAISTIFGRHADKRFLQALADTGGGLRERFYYQVTGRDTEEFWFDYISDVADGFSPTYTLARLLSMDTLDLAERNCDERYSTKRGEILIFGGDEVYPIASVKDYKERLTDPYSAAFPMPGDAKLKKPENQERPFAFAIPGNHDWYDSLVVFSRLFFLKRPFAGWKTIQNRSYFAIQLPRGWWLFGTDMQLGSSLDNAQIDYFKQVMTLVPKDDRIILCTAEPYWITEKMYETDPAYVNRNLGYFVGGVLKRQVAIYIAGDRHYYRHHELVKIGGTEIPSEATDKIHKIVAGGGGAFLHPTHNENVGDIGKSEIYKLRASYPDETTSWWLTFWNLLFPILNWRFGIVTGVLYVLTAQAFFASMGAFSGQLTDEPIHDVFVTFLSQPVAFFWVLLIIVAFVFFTDAHSKLYQRIAGPIHAIAHLIGLFFVAWITSRIVFNGLAPSDTIWGILLAGIGIFVGGGVMGSAIMGLYLLISLNIFGVHHNEAFSSIKVESYKNFLRLKIEANGDLTIFPIGMDRMTKTWKPYSQAVSPRIAPADTVSEDRPFLIENPIEYKKPLVTSGDENEEVVFSVIERAL